MISNSASSSSVRSATALPNNGLLLSSTLWTAAAPPPHLMDCACSRNLDVRQPKKHHLQVVAASDPSHRLIRGVRLPSAWHSAPRPPGPSSTAARASTGCRDTAPSATYVACPRSCGLARTDSSSIPGTGLNHRMFMWRAMIARPSSGSRRSGFTKNDGFRSAELQRMAALIEANEQMLLEAWHGYFSQ